MVALTVNEILQAFSPAFKSIDVRIVAVKLEDQWRNVITSVFLSFKSQEEIKSEQQQVRETLPETDKFCILLDCYSFDSISDLFNQIKKAEIEMHGRVIRFQPFDPSKLTIEAYQSYLKKMNNWKVIGSHATATLFDGVWPVISDQDGPARLVGYANAYEMIKETINIREFDPSIKRVIVIGIPIPARISDISFDGKSVKVKIKKPFSLNDLQLNLSIERINPNALHFEPFWRKTQSVKKRGYPLKRGFCCVTNSIKLANSKPHDRIEVELIHRKVPTLSMDKGYSSIPLENAVEPFAKAFSAFCSLDVFKERLLNPERFVEGRKKPNTIFENAVAWLLSLVGFSVLPLGRDFEILRIPETGYQLGSVDIIAYRENEHLLLVDCDTSIPDEKKIRSLMTVTDHFKYIQDEHKQPQITSAIFSPKNCTGIPAVTNSVKIVDRYQIEQAFEEAISGNMEQARSFLL